MNCSTKGRKTPSFRHVSVQEIPKKIVKNGYQVNLVEVNLCGTTCRIPSLCFFNEEYALSLKPFRKVSKGMYPEECIFTQDSSWIDDAYWLDLIEFYGPIGALLECYKLCAKSKGIAIFNKEDWLQNITSNLGKVGEEASKMDTPEKMHQHCIKEALPKARPNNELGRFGAWYERSEVNPLWRPSVVQLLCQQNEKFLSI